MRILFSLSRRLRFAALLLVFGACAPALAQTEAPAVTGTVSVEDLMAPSKLPDAVLGDEKAKVTIVEYASLTCPHCASFHTGSLPALKRDYIDTGKVRFIYRNFPFDNAAIGTSMLSVCAGEKRFFGIIETFFAKQEFWTSAQDPQAAVMTLWKEAGFTQESFEECLQKQEIYDAVLDVRKRAYEKFGVDSTPTIFVNGARYRGALSPAQLDAVLKPLLADNK